MMRSVGEIIQGEVELVWESGCRKMKEKTQHLYRRWKNVGTRREEELQGIAITDHELDRFCENGGLQEHGLEVNCEFQEPPTYGGCNISDNQRRLLRLPPKFTTYEEISEKEMEVEMEVANCKLRWELMNRREREEEGESEEWTEEWEMERMEKETTYDSNSKVLDFRKKRVTDLPTCRRIVLPEAQGEDNEVVMRSMTQRLKSTVSTFKREQCDTRGRVKWDNLDTRQRKGLQECQELKRKGEQMYVLTDKSMKIAVDTHNNYLSKMEAHIRDDVVIDQKSVDGIERELSGHGIMWARMLQIGENWNQKERVKSAMTCVGGSIPPLYGLIKDHKQVQVGHEELGPPTRPVCGATKSPNGALSSILSEILDRLSDCEDKNISSECRSTEEMVAEITRVNQTEKEYINEKRVIFSTDVKALYPSLKADNVAEVLSDMYKESELKICVDQDELSLYLALVADGQEIRENNLGSVVKKWKHEIGGRGRRPGITTAEVMGGREQRKNSKFLPADRRPNQEEERKMVALALKKGIQAVMKNHLYVSEDKVYKQREGGPIGLQVTGAIARAFMVWWDQKLMTRMRDATSEIEWKCHMYMRYVDDGNIICTPFPVGSKESDGKIRVQEGDRESDISVPDDRRTAEIVQKVANSICDFIQVEVDYPTAHDNLHMPILDLEVAMKEDKVMYRHYRKRVANPLVIHQKSAMPSKVKRTCLTNEVIRIMRNTSRDVPDEVRRFFLSEFAQRLRMSGYPEQFRREILVAGLKGYDKQVRKSDNGECPLHRPKGYRMEERRRKKMIKRRAWYKPFDTVLFCPPTPRGQLAKRLRDVTQEVSERHGLKVKVVERSGRSLRSQLTSKGSKVMCRNVRDCIVHRNGGRGDCGKEGVVYKGTCITCSESGIASKPDNNGDIIRVAREDRRSIDSVYYGETSKSCYTRGRQHIECLESEQNQSRATNAFVRHRDIYHKDEEDNVKYRVDVVKSFKKPLERQVWEGVEIHSSQAEIPMNSKLDHYQPAVGRMEVRFEL